MDRVIVLLFAALWCLFAPAANAQDKPNIVLVMVDDMGYSDPGCYGGEIETPHLDALAEAGLRFSQFYNTARCWPTRACLNESNPSLACSFRRPSPGLRA